MACPPVHGDNPQAYASGLSSVQVDKHGITILYHLHLCRTCIILQKGISSSNTMACPPVCGDNPHALASGLSYVQVNIHGITILYHLHQCRTCTFTSYFVL